MSRHVDDDDDDDDSDDDVVSNVYLTAHEDVVRCTRM